MQKLKSYDGYMFIYFCFALYSTHNSKKKKSPLPGSNRRPSPCKGDVITNYTKRTYSECVNFPKFFGLRTFFNFF